KVLDSVQIRCTSLHFYYAIHKFSVKTEAVEDKQPQTVQKIASNAENSLPKNLHFNLKVNTEYLELLNNSSQVLVEGNRNKFGGDLGQSSINIHIKDFKILQTTNNKKYMKLLQMESLILLLEKL
ncbi:hypothetical protein NXZ77_21960, partial [Lysinibacillus boronitolerans]|uniref:hypothetical protein n=1 Tax=Lysinibacillus boronitolerans TaxID=309788 RepID=UPI002161A774